MLNMIPVVGHFWPQRHNLNNLGRDPHLHTRNQGSNLSFVVSDKVFPIYGYVKHVAPGVSPFLVPVS